MTFACVTPTKHRPMQMKFAVDCMNAQTLQPDVWTIADDCETPLSDALLGDAHCWVNYFHNEPIKGNSTCQNLETALWNAEADIYVVIEDDDYYPPNYLENVSKLLNVDRIIGCSRWPDYKLGSCRWQERFFNKAETHSLAFKGEDIKQFVLSVLSMSHGKPYPDKELRWNMDIPVVDYKSFTPISLKDWGLGTPGTERWHKKDFGEFDENLAKFKEWLGGDWRRYETFLGWRLERRFSA